MTDYYDPKLYSADDVNAGQRKINFALTQVDEKLVAVLIAVANALKEPPGEARNHVPAIEAGIREADRILKHVASIRPPGCDTTWKPEPEI